jgi:deazaflavin-dependent oxidoreductase (nitroreductase family)
MKTADRGGQMALVTGVARIASRLASTIGPSGMRMVAHVNKYLTNRAVRLWAGRVPHMAVIEHVGRRSGRTYKTPVMVFRSGQFMSVVLNYGVRSDWVQNVLAADQAWVTHRGYRYRLHDPALFAGHNTESPIESESRSTATVLRATLNNH